MSESPIENGFAKSLRVVMHENVHLSRSLPNDSHFARQAVGTGAVGDCTAGVGLGGVTGVFFGRGWSGMTL